MKPKLRKVKGECACEVCGEHLYPGEKGYAVKDTDGSLRWFCESHKTPTVSVLLADLEELLDYCQDDEEKHWEENGEPARHIVHTIRRLRSVCPFP